MGQKEQNRRKTKPGTSICCMVFAASFQHSKAQSIFGCMLGYSCHCPTLHGKFPEETLGQMNIFGSQQVINYMLHSWLLRWSEVLVRSVPCPGPFDQVCWWPSSVTQLASVSLLSRNHPPTAPPGPQHALRTNIPIHRHSDCQCRYQHCPQRRGSTTRPTQRVRLRARSLRAPAWQR